MEKPILCVFLKIKNILQNWVFHSVHKILNFNAIYFGNTIPILNSEAQEWRSKKYLTFYTLNKIHTLHIYICESSRDCSHVNTYHKQEILIFQSLSCPFVNYNYNFSSSITKKNIVVNFSHNKYGLFVKFRFSWIR